MDEQRVELETQFAVLCEKVDRLTDSVFECTSELRAQASRAAARDTEMKLFEDRLDRIMREVYTGDNASRIRVLELHVRGLYALVAFLCISIAGKYLPLVWGAIVAGK